MGKKQYIEAYSTSLCISSFFNTFVTVIIGILSSRNQILD